MSGILTLDSMKDLSADEIARLYQLGYKIESLVDPVVNFGKITVYTGYNNLATSITLNTGDGAKLPNPATDGAFNLIWYNSSDYVDPSDDPFVEIIRATTKTLDTLTVTRAQEGTIATNKNIVGKTYKMILSPTKKTITDINTEKVSKSGDTMTDTLNLPSSGLTVGTNQLLVSGGNVGIGTITPLQKLEVTGCIKSTSNSVNFAENSVQLDYYLGAGRISSYINTGSSLQFFTNPNAGLSTERMRIDSNGNVGIGTSNINQMLTIYSGVSKSLSITGGSGAQNILIGNQDAGGTNHPAIIQSANGNIWFGSGTSWSDPIGGTFTPVMTILGGGYVGIGTTTPSSLFTVRNPLTHTQIDLDSSAVDRVSNINLLNNGIFKWSFSSRGTLDIPNNRLSLYNSSGSEVFTVLQTGNIGLAIGNPIYQLQLSTDSAAKPGTNTWTISSDERIKKDIRPFTDGIQTILNINPVWYKYNGKAGFKEDDKDHIGVIGQHIQNIAPYTINTYNAKLNEEDEEETELLNFNSHALTFVLINAIKELKKKFENEIDNLKEEIKILKTSKNG